MSDIDHTSDESSDSQEHWVNVVSPEGSWLELRPGRAPRPDIPMEEETNSSSDGMSTSWDSNTVSSIPSGELTTSMSEHSFDLNEISDMDYTTPEDEETESDSSADAGELEVPAGVEEVLGARWNIQEAQWEAWVRREDQGNPVWVPLTEELWEAVRAFLLALEQGGLGA